MITLSDRLIGLAQRTRERLDNLAALVTAKLDKATADTLYAPVGGTSAWGSITGTLSAQIDLQAALNAKQAAGSYLTGNQSITLSGDATGAGATAIAVTLSTVNASPGTFGDATYSLTATVDGKGRITALSAQLVTPAFASLTAKPTTVSGYGITDAQSLNANLTAYAGAAWSAGVQVPALTAANTITLKTVGSATGNLLDKAAGDSLYQPTGAYLTANQSITLSGDAAGSGTTAITVTIGANKVTRAMMAQTAAATVLGSTAAGNVVELTAAQGRTVLGLATVASSGLASDLTGTLAAAQLPALTGGDVTSSAGSATLTIGAGKVTLAMQANLAADSFIGNNTGSPATPIAMTVAQAKTLLAITESDVANLTTDLAAKASLASPTLTGTPAAPTAGAGTNTTQIATTAFVATSFAPLASPQLTGVAFYQQVAPTAVNSTATLTIAQLLTLIITTTSASAVTLTLPTGTLTDAGILSGALATNEAFEWYLINLGSSTGAVTLSAGTAHTIVGSPTVAISTSARFLTRKTATNTFITYRIA